MKIAFISDVHGNAVALEAVLKDIENREVDKVMVLGDLCFRGPEPKRSLDLIRALKTDVIKGNADEWIVRGIHNGEAPDDAIEMMNRERIWALSQLNEEDLEYLDSLPKDLVGELEFIKFHAFHATPNNLFDVVHPYERDEILNEIMLKNDVEISIYAHIHKPFIRYIDGKCLMNIGSVGLPLDGVSKSSYGLLEVEDNICHTSILRVPYNIDKVLEQLIEKDYPNVEYISKVLVSAKI